MRRNIALSLVLIFLVFFLPWLWGGPSSAADNGGLDATPPASGETESGADISEPENGPDPLGTDTPAPAPQSEIDKNTLISVLLEGELKQLNMRDYLMGVLRAEMPASFELDALKSQAVAARTYVLYKILHGGSPNHPEADACDDITCCQAFMPFEVAAQGWGADADANEEKIRQAVIGTDGECVLYGGEPVLAVFHSSSAGTTQDAAAVWSSGMPYLQSVETPENEDTVPGYHSQASFPVAELKERLLSSLPNADLSGSPSNWFTNISQQPNGTVTAVTVGGVELTGSQLRSILELRSACFTISFDSENVVFSVTGYGHGVGMSQYGANVLAAQGMGYKDILSWYYTDTAVGTYALDR